jgi:restriction endonuclease
VAGIEKGEIADILAPGDAADATNAVKGAALEKAIRHAFTQIPGVACEMQDALNSFKGEEVDLLLSNLAHEDGLAQFGPELLVEAKNWSKKVGAMEINWFATKMRRRNVPEGVLVAAKGITGDAELLTAARQQIAFSLTEGQPILVLLRDELESVPSGGRLAELLHKKRAELIGRQELYFADPRELRQGAGFIKFGSRAFEKILRGERVKRIDEALARGQDLPETDAQRAALVGAGLAAVQKEANAGTQDTARDPMGYRLREELMHVAATCAAWLADLGFEKADGIQVNATLSGMDRVRMFPGSKLWKALTDYYASELASDGPEMDKELVLFALMALLVEEIWSLDEYTPDPEDY